jgi:hypothetical protein
MFDTAGSNIRYCALTASDASFALAAVLTLALRVRPRR